jgi:hypothetical protein
MKKIITVVFLMAATCTFAGFDSVFYNKTLRIDYVRAGDHENESYFLDEVLIEPFWAGSHVNLIDTFYYGDNFFKVYDQLSDSLIYSRGYSTLFGEWQTTGEAKMTAKAFPETIVMPLPRSDSRIELFSRNAGGEFEKVFEYMYAAGNPYISPERRHTYSTFDVHISDDPNKCVDIVIIPDGYKATEMGRFISDCQQFASVLFSYEPYSNHKEKFNIRGVLAPSSDSGSDIPPDSVWVNTLLSSSFYTFESERYCMSNDHKTVRDVAANAPYDQIYILVNSDKYGGGAIYNYYCLSVNSSVSASKIFIHELGHGFAGLGDEYYDSEVAYTDFYSTDLEPWEPNLTTLVDFDNKWSSLIEPGTPVPTPNIEPYADKTGVFEGGGYSAKNIYRPAYDCLMNSFRGNTFCEVCKNSIEKMILFYTE